MGVVCLFVFLKAKESEGDGAQKLGAGPEGGCPRLSGWRAESRKGEVSE